ncbi:MAG: signal peptide peptidase SppA [Candidatus Electryonea clarkiae]|nr:signal peptide peptidase SppA [Candidatus Electryonea clarkiae]MDP8287955.1 signal peptide peptidase SppA [Candidatus Electryonea clarkiae]
MLRLKIVGLALLLMTISVQAQPAGSFTAGNGASNHSLIPLPYGPRALPDGVGAIWTNPAGIGIDMGSGFLLMNYLTQGDSSSTGFKEDWGYALAGDVIGFGHEISRTNVEASRYTWGMSFPSDGFSVGFAYHWSKDLDRQNSYDLGMLVRPTKWLSFGTQITEVGRPRYGTTRMDPSYHFGLAVRPIGHRVTLTADASLWKTDNADPVLWDESSLDYGDKLDLTFTANIQPVDNLAVRAGYAVDREMIFGGVSIYSGMFSVSNHNATQTKGDNRAYNNVSTNWIRMSSEWSPHIGAHFMPKKVVKLKFKGKIVEEPSPFSMFSPKYSSLLGVLNRIKQLCEDETVSGLLIEIEGQSMGFSDRIELRDELKKFKESGKKIVVYSRHLELGSYYLASVADRIVLHPSGEVFMPGIDARRRYLKGLLDKIGMEAQFIQVGKYKSAAEMLTREDMSDPAREAIDAIIEVIWQEIITGIAEGRNVSKEDVMGWIDEAGYMADDALEAGWIDAIAFDDEIKKQVDEEFGEEKFRLVSSKSYFMKKPVQYEWENMTSPKIAIIYATGSIVTGNSSGGGLFGGKTMGSETIAKAIRQARKDKRVKAIVFRIDSGGGSALASDIILREIERTTNDDIEDVRHIPVIVSMSDVAGSGGYYIACKADTIVAPKTCITGSIGVIGGKFVTKELTDKIGVTYDGVQRGKNAGVLSSAERWNDEQQAKVKDLMLGTYDRFLVHVAEGREGLDTARVHELGQGRIWSGVDALEHDLIDINGGFFTAIEIAKKAAGIKEGRVVEAKIYPGIHGYNFATDVRALIVGELPIGIREALEAEAFVNSIDEGEPVLLGPIVPEDMVSE